MTTLELMNGPLLTLKDLTPRERAIALRSRIDTLTVIQEVPCKCERSRLPELFEIIKAIKWESEQQLKNTSDEDQ